MTRPIHKVRLDKVRPAVVLTRPVAVSFLSSVTVAPITTTVYGIATEVPVGPENGLARSGVISCDNVMTIAVVDLLEQIGILGEGQERLLTMAIHQAFDLDESAG